MELEQASPEIEQEDKFANLKKVTPLSKYLAMILFIAMPFIGGWIGYRYAPEKVFEVEKVVVQEVQTALVEEMERQVNIHDRDVGKDEFVGAISTIVKKSDGYWMVCGGEFGVKLVSYKLPEWPIPKSTFRLIEDSNFRKKEYRIADDAHIKLISHQRGENDDDKYRVDADVLYGVYQGEIDEFYYYGLPDDEYPFEIIITNGEVVSISQIYIE